MRGRVGGGESKDAQECAGMRRNARFQKYVFHYYSSQDGRNSTPLQNHFDFICTVMKSRMQHIFKSGVRWQVSTQPENKMLKKRHQCCKKKSKREIPEKSRQWKSICLRPLSFIFSQSSVGLFSLSVFTSLYSLSCARKSKDFDAFLPWLVKRKENRIHLMQRKSRLLSNIHGNWSRIGQETRKDGKR